LFCKIGGALFVKLDVLAEMADGKVDGKADGARKR
jgi:hypothetical protein